MNEKKIIVTVIALCYNHEKYVLESLQSVVNQGYGNVELIVVDDFSIDKSREKILQFVENNANTRIIFNEKNIGNCRSFNQALKIAQGKYIIDLSTDDIMLPNRISEQVKVFEKSAKVGLVFSDCEYIDEQSRKIEHSTFNDFRKKKNEFPVGNVYAQLLAKKLYINPPTMMVRKTIFDQLGGYDETLTYEDFDFWLRASRICKFDYLPEILMQQRMLSGSHSTKFIQKKNSLTPSVFRVCQKAFLFNETEEENLALIIRLKSLMRQCFFTEHFEVGKEVLKMLKQLKAENWEIKLYTILIFSKLPINFLYLKYNAFRKYLYFRL
ncbi:glycosyl transferase family 2 [Arcicella aurantiaca]|uniref:Glycosyl transferase family 2 n=1 Tax=Arcicella aurantiaca TaxID=591202 RepID=A0A316EFU3_9BACT|nr:glycosyltransferase [Arcicella aurantiaca]PWK29450.1 glycosyl transferase family 2 [Arcicella aurantiaca]